MDIYDRLYKNVFHREWFIFSFPYLIEPWNFCLVFVGPVFACCMFRFGWRFRLFLFSRTCFLLFFVSLCFGFLWFDLLKVFIGFPKTGTKEVIFSFHSSALNIADRFARTKRCGSTWWGWRILSAFLPSLGDKRRLAKVERVKKSCPSRYVGGWQINAYIRSQGDGGQSGDVGRFGVISPRILWLTAARCRYFLLFTVRFDSVRFVRGLFVTPVIQWTAVVQLYRGFIWYSCRVASYRIKDTYWYTGLCQISFIFVK